MFCGDLLFRFVVLRVSLVAFYFGYEHLGSLPVEVGFEAGGLF